jgi:GTP-binding protein HflX
MVFNKIDKVKVEEGFEPELHENGNSENGQRTISLNELKATHMARSEGAVFISAAKNVNIEELKDQLADKVAQRHFTIFPNYIKKEIY